MKIGSRVQVKGGLIGEFIGLAGVGSVRVRIGECIRTIPLSFVKKPRTSHKWPIGSAAAVCIDGISVRGVIVSARGSGPRVKITDGHPIWHGATVGTNDGKIKRIENE